MKWLPFNFTKQEKEALKSGMQKTTSKKWMLGMILFAVVIIAGIILLYKNQLLLRLFVGIAGITLTGFILNRNRQMAKNPNVSPALISAMEKMDDYIIKENKKTAKASFVVFWAALIFFIVFMGGLIFYVLVVKPYFPLF